MAFFSFRRSWLRFAACGCWLAIAAGGCIKIRTVVQEVVLDSELVAFDDDVPKAPASLPLYKLTTARSGLRLGQRDCPANERTGENTCYEPEAWRPNCSTPKPGQPPDPLACGEPADPRRALATARDFLSRDFLPKDASQFTLERGRVLSHTRVRRDAQGAWHDVAGARPWMVMASARRTVGGFAVDGPGSRAMVAVRNAPVAAIRTWKSAAASGEVKAKHASEAEVRAEIAQQLVALRPRTPVHVQRIELAYYDANADLIQPVYRFVAEFSSDRSTIGRSEHVVGYVPYADTAEALPLLSDGDLKGPGGPAPTPPPPPPAGAVRVGRYVVKDDNKGWVRDANGFMDTLLAPGAVIPFTSTQYEDAAPEQFTTQSASFVNSVDIALVEAHGAPWQFATERNCCETVEFNEQGFPAYGAAAGGNLKHLVLHSCDVLPVKPDLSNWANPWKRVFKGLHSVLGYRSPMYINDGAGAAFARNLASGAPVVPAWFCAVTSLNLYQLGPSTHHRCEGEVPMGRPAAVTACGAGNETAQENATIEPDCLDAWWIDDALVHEQE
ncbi:MAG TPA: DUF6345 domain-containing protein [Polyangiales bacterium]|nr:DUF6345 domain-containing protein [Polyangiales bacterium]